MLAIRVITCDCHLKGEKLLWVACKLNQLLKNLAHIGCQQLFLLSVGQLEVYFDVGARKVLLRGKFAFARTQQTRYYVYGAVGVAEIELTI